MFLLTENLQHEQDVKKGKLRMEYLWFEFGFFFLYGCFTKSKGRSLPYYLPIFSRGTEEDFCIFQGH